ncbi:MAG: hypothetical protein CL903_04855 [Dehalococcoidia bacterium]|nr:hypothetical protein [Dehalococcoidia bacterium]|tara:strand:+ start:5674 stop:5988 length:315 start_codon:yes stop_codon:yes gene_type:complete
MNPVIKNKNNYKNPILSIEDKVGDYVMLYVVHKKGESSPDHTHPWEHQAYITTGEGVLVCNGEEYPIKEGDCILVPANHRHQFINRGEKNLERVTVNPRNSVEN